MSLSKQQLISAPIAGNRPPLSLPLSLSVCFSPPLYSQFFLPSSSSRAIYCTCFPFAAAHLCLHWQLLTVTSCSTHVHVSTPGSMSFLLMSSASTSFVSTSPVCLSFAATALPQPQPGPAPAPAPGYNYNYSKKQKLQQLKNFAYFLQILRANRQQESVSVTLQKWAEQSMMFAKTLEANSTRNDNSLRTSVIR